MVNAIRKYGGKLLIKPAQKNVRLFLKNMRKFIRENRGLPTAVLIWQLNARIRGWANYYRHVVSKRMFSLLDHNIFQAIWRYIVRRHPKKNRKWLKEKYFRSQGLQNWIFFTAYKDKMGNTKYLDLFKANSVPIKRHVKIRATANPFNAQERDYFEKRRNRHKVSPPMMSRMAYARSQQGEYTQPGQPTGLQRT